VIHTCLFPSGTGGGVCGFGFSSAMFPTPC
jgi:hypothetical protein